MAQEDAVDLGWSGILTLENIDNVAALLRQLLEGKTFLSVVSNELGKFRPYVRTGCTIRSPGGIWVHKSVDRSYGSININEKNGIWTIITTRPTGGHSDSKDTYLEFELVQVTIKHRAIRGNLLYWVFKIQP